jgi:hypothetical protein
MAGPEEEEETEGAGLRECHDQPHTPLTPANAGVQGNKL